MRVNVWRGTLAIALGFAFLSCTDATGPKTPENGMVAGGSVLKSVTVPSIVISQVYGGGGNSGATYRNDFIELFNPGTSSVNVSGWSVQYTSPTGTAWSATALSGSIPAGGYYLIQEAKGANDTSTILLPTPDATGTIAMGAGAGKVLLSSGTTALSTACPTTSVIDEVSFGSTATNCGGGTTAAPANATAAIRNGNGCTYTNTLSADFTIAAPTPRNSSTAVNVCPAVALPVKTVTVSPNPVTLTTGSNQTFTAVAHDSTNAVVSTTFTWSSDNTAVATINPTTGVATAVAIGTTKIRATSTNSVADSAVITVTAAPSGDVVISQVFGGGGNSGASYQNDYVELFNRGTDPADISGWTIQYSSAGGSSWASVVLPSGTIAPGKYYLVQLASNAAVGATLPTPDASATTPNMSATSGKIILTLPGVVPGAVACPTSGVVDKVGYGTSTNCSVTWTGATATLSPTTAAFRKNDGCIKTGNITNDFIVLPPNPHNSSSPAKSCAPGAPRPQSTATIVINELMADPANAETPSFGEWFEVKNYGAQPVNLKGWTIITGGTSQPDHTISADVIVPAGGFAVLGRSADDTRNGGLTVDYSYFTGIATTIWLDDQDFLELVDTQGARADSVAWTSMPHGVTRALRDASLPHADVNGSDWGYSTTVFGAGDYGTPDAENGTLSDTAPVVTANKISISGRVATDAPLPVGFESQLFASEATQDGTPISTTFTWASQTPDIASVDSRGVIHAISAGTAKFLVTATDGTARVYPLVMSTPVASTTAQYLDNAAFGEPTGVPADNIIIRRPQYTTSFSQTLHTTSWVAYDLNNTDIVSGQDRCNCFTFDPELISAGQTPYNTADYTGAGAFFGVDANGAALHGVDRGHMVRSFDRTAGTLDNARTFYLANVVPQFSDLNQGPWANFENYLGDFAQNQNKEVYIYAGPAGSLGTVKNEGKINFPAYTWKIALILPRGKGLADVRDYRDVQIVAVVMPNTYGIRNVDWATSYVVKPDSVQKLTGFQFLTALDARTRRALLTETQPPLGSVDGPYTSAEGSSVNMSAGASVDPNGSIVSYAWNFGDGSTATGSSVSHTYANNGSYNVSMIVTDNDGLVDTVATTATVSNVTPVVQAFSGASLLPGETYTANGTFTDPGADVWSGTVDYGDGSGSQSLALTGQTFSLSHTYNAVGSFTATVGVFDGDATGSLGETVTVISAADGLANLTSMVNTLISGGGLASGNGNALLSKLDAATKQLAAGKNSAAITQLQSFIGQVDSLVAAGRLDPTQGAALKALATRLIATASM